MHTRPEEINQPPEAMVRWRVKSLPNGKCQFLIDLKKDLESIIDLKSKTITFNGKTTKFLNNPCTFNEIQRL